MEKQLAPSEGVQQPAQNADTEVRFRDLVESLNAIVWEMDLSTWLFTYVSARAEAMLGYPLERWYREEGFWASILVHPDDQDWAVPFCVSATEEGRDHEFEYRARTRDGRTVWLHDVVRVVPDEAGQPTLLRGVMVDITEKREAQAALRRAGERQEALLNGAAEGIYGLDLEGRTTFVNPAGLRMLGWDSPDDLLGKPQHDLIHHTRADGTLYRREECRIYKTLRDGEARSAEDEVFWTRQGECFPVAYNVTPIRMGDRITGAVVTFRDVTAERERARRDREREQQLAEAQQIARVGSWDWSVSDNRVSWSDELYRIYGMPPGVPISFEIFLERVHPEDRDWVAKLIQRAMETHEPFSYEHRAVRPDGEVRYLHGRGRVILDAAGQLTRMVGTGQDITERRKAEERELMLVREQAARERAEAEEERLGFLAEAGAVLASTLDYEQTLRSVAHLAVPRLGDWCAIDMLDGSGEIRRLVTVHPDPAKEALAEELQRRFPTDPNATYGIPQVLRSGEPELVPSMDDALLDRLVSDETQRAILRELGLRSYIVAPLIARGRTLGAITLVYAESGRSYGADDLRMVMELGQRAALAVDNARLFQEARAAQREVKRILESITDAFFAVDPDLRVTYANAQAERVLQATGPDLVGKPIAESLPAGLSDRLLASFHTARDEDRQTDFQAFYAPLDIWLEVRVFPWDEGLSVFLRDVTERVIAEREVRRSEQRYRSLVEATSAIVWRAPASGAFEDDQPGWMQFTGQRAEDVRGEGWLKALHPDDRAPTLDAWREALRTREIYQVEHRLRRSDGEYRTMQARAVPIAEDGEIIEWVGVHTDVTEQRRFEAERERLLHAVETERARLNELIMRAPAVMAIYTGPDHVITTVNPTWEEVVGKRHVVGKTFRDAFPEFAETGLFEQLDETYATGEVWRANEVHVHLLRDGRDEADETFWNVVWQPLKDAAGQVESILVHAVEVTTQVIARREVERKAEELAQLARDLERSNRDLDQFAYVASHDLKAPLRGISTLSQWLEEDLAEHLTDETRQQMDLLRGRVSRMEGLINGILQYSRIGRTQEKPERIEVAELMRGVVDLLAPPKHIEVKIEEGLPALVSERLPLEQVFMNLVGNAVKYHHGDAGQIRIGAEQKGDVWEFHVADNGPGIAPEYHERIFGIFQTLNARDSVESTGIGLSLVKKIVESRGGSVWVESDENAGATFRFTWRESPPGQPAPR